MEERSPCAWTRMNAKSFRGSSSVRFHRVTSLKSETSVKSTGLTGHRRLRTSSVPSCACQWQRSAGVTTRGRHKAYRLMNAPFSVNPGTEKSSFYGTSKIFNHSKEILQCWIWETSNATSSLKKSSYWPPSHAVRMVPNWSPALHVGLWEEEISDATYRRQPYCEVIAWENGQEVLELWGFFIWLFYIIVVIR